MICPGCGSAMSTLALEDRIGGSVEIDVCSPCHVFWFDRYENIRLGASATLKLFEVMADQDAASRSLAQPLKCPRCASHLALEHDMAQRGTAFEYWACPHEHGHLITFLQFLKEKNFVRPLTPQQIAELRQNVQMLNCSNCGGPIDLAKESVCPHCGSPLTMLDLKQIAAHVRELQQCDAAAHADGDADASITADREIARQLAATIASLTSDSRPPSLIRGGLRQLARWLAE
jgi:Zn-finger nucleic acid-binding protein